MQYNFYKNIVNMSDVGIKNINASSRSARKLYNMTEGEIRVFWNNAFIVAYNIMNYYIEQYFSIEESLSNGEDIEQKTKDMHVCEYMASFYQSLLYEYQHILEISKQRK